MDQWAIRQLSTIRISNLSGIQIPTVHIFTKVKTISFFRAQKEGSEDGDHHSTHSHEHESDQHHQHKEGDDEVAAAKPAKPKGASIFGQAKPVDTTAREKEIEERLRKKTTEEIPEVEKENGEHRGER